MLTRRVSDHARHEKRKKKLLARLQKLKND
jgi:hypothetical protein